MTPKPLVNIIILNWNGWQDTIECLDSLFKITYLDYKVILIDNDSANDSCDRILDYLQKTFTCECISEKWNQTQVLFENDKISFIKNSENAGFARGCNLGMDYADFRGWGSLVLLLNNDTEVEQDFLELLVDFYMKAEYKAICPQIRYHYDKKTIWNCGGILRGGFKSYYYKNKSYQRLPDKEFLPISFITGCALLYDYQSLGKLSERFFFGEEDVEFSFRCKSNNIKMASLLTSVIYHKVGRSTKNIGVKQMAFLHIDYLNKLIDYRKYVKIKCYYWIWLAINMLFLYRYLTKIKIASFNQKYSLIRNIIQDSRIYDKVDKKIYLSVLSKYLED